MTEPKPLTKDKLVKAIDIIDVINNISLPNGLTKSAININVEILMREYVQKDKIKSAVEWLKDNVRKYPNGVTNALYKSEIIGLLDKAFEGVMQDKG